jgi:hypothetical protein
MRYLIQSKIYNRYDNKKDTKLVTALVERKLSEINSPAAITAGELKTQIAATFPSLTLTELKLSVQGVEQLDETVIEKTSVLFEGTFGLPAAPVLTKDEEKSVNRANNAAKASPARKASAAARQTTKLAKASAPAAAIDPADVKTKAEQLKANWEEYKAKYIK